MPWPYYNPFCIKLTVEFLKDPLLEADVTHYSDTYWYRPKLAQLSKAEIEFGAYLIDRKRFLRLTGFNPHNYINNYFDAPFGMNNLNN